MRICDVAGRLEDGGNEVAELARGDDSDGEDGDAPDDREVAGALLGCEDLAVQEAQQEVLLGGRAPRRRQETLLRGPVQPTHRSASKPTAPHYAVIVIRTSRIQD